MNGCCPRTETDDMMGCIEKMKFRFRIFSFVVALLMLVSFGAVPVMAAKIDGKTGIGMAEWAFKAYNEGWTYKWGGSSAGKAR